MKLGIRWMLACSLAGCSPPPALTPSNPATMVGGAAALGTGDRGRVEVIVAWPEALRAAESLPLRAQSIAFTVFDASQSVVATASIVRQAAEATDSAQLDLPVTSGLTLEAAAGTPETARVAVGRSLAFSVHRNQLVEVSVTLDPVIRTLAGPGDGKYSGDGGPALLAGLTRMYGITAGQDGTVYVPDFSNHAIRAIAPAGLIRTVVGLASGSAGVPSTASPDNSGEGGLASEATLRNPYGAYVTSAGDLFTADSLTNTLQRLRMVPAAAGMRFGKTMAAGHIYTLATAASSAYLGVSMILDTDGSLLYSDQFNKKIWRMAPDGTASVLVGNNLGSTSDGSLPGDVALTTPWGLALDGHANLVFSEATPGRLRMFCRSGGTYFGKVMAPGRVYTIMDASLVSAWTVKDASGNSLARLPYPRRLAFDQEGDLYFVDNLGYSVYRVDHASAGVTRVAGGRPTPSNATDSAALGDEGAASQCTLSSPMAMTIDGLNRLIIGDTNASRVRAVHL